MRRSKLAPRTRAKRASLVPAHGPATPDHLRRPIVVVLGMHRSGTSAITRGLQTLGLELGDKLMPAVPNNNERGFFEDLEINALNERLLAKAGSAWHKLAPLKARWTGEDFSRERRDATALLARKTNAQMFAFKDPRTALLLPFWQCVFEDLDLDDRYLIAVRNPLDIALSLEARDGFQLTKGLLLWAKHQIEAVRFTEGKARIFVSYDRVLENPAQQLERIANGLGLPARELDGPALQAFAEEFLAPSLRHNRVGRSELQRSGLAPDFIARLYETLRELTQAENSSGAIDAFEWRKILDGYEELLPILGYADRLDVSERAARANAKDLEQKLRAIEAALAASAAEIADLKASRDTLALAETRAKDLEQKLKTIEGELAASTAEVADLKAGRDALAQTLADTRAQASRMRRAAQRRARKLTALFDALTHALRTNAAKTGAAAAAAVEEIAALRALVASEASLRTELVKQLVAAEDNKELLALRQRLATSIGALGDAMAQARARAEASALEITALREDRARTLEARQALAAALAELERAARAQNARVEENASLIAEIAALREAQASANHDNEALTTQLGDLREAHAHALSALAVELQDFAAALGAAEARNSALLAEKEEYERALNALSETARNAESARGALAAEYEALSKRDAERDLELESLKQRCQELESQHREAARRAAQLTEERAKRAATDAEALSQAKAQGAGLAKQFHDTRRDLLLARAALTEIKRSTSWRITLPLRLLMRAARDPLGVTRRGVRFMARAAWRSLPMPPEQRGRLAARMFAMMPPPLLSWSRTYRAWRANRPDRPARRAARKDDSSEPAPAPALEGFVPLLATEPPEALAARAIAFYLPQFHPIPENNAWWGEGFTEWTKVRAAKPLFEGHYQPHEPGELGYYDLLKSDGVMRRQAELARLHGISGFCFYFYWFAGKRLLEAPIQKFAESEDIDFPFCLCWANENWTRRWDGQDEEVLIAQAHSSADDIAFIAHVSQYFKNKNYIRINGRPLLLVYRPALLPSAKATADRWRRWLREHGLGEVYLAYTQSFERAPPADYGFDAAVEFPPNNMRLVSDQSLVNGCAPDSQLSVFDWSALSARARDYQAPRYKLFRSVAPSWDNTPRRGERGAVFVNTSPTSFSAWLAGAVRDTQKRFSNEDERLVFINAWNEWAEGAHLEPDKRYGYAWLEAARRALSPGAEAQKLIIVTHDLQRHGAQYIALHLAQALRQRFGIEVYTIAGRDGVLADAFKRQGPLTILDRFSSTGSETSVALAQLAARGFRRAIVNSAASAWIAPALARAGIRHIGLVHELPGMIKHLNLQDDLRALDQHAQAIVFPAAMVRNEDATAIGVEHWRSAIVMPQGLYKTGIVANADKDAARERLRRSLNLPTGVRILLGVGFADHRKGADRFVAWAAAATARWPDLHAIWAGEIAADARAEIEHAMKVAGVHAKRIHFVGFHRDTTDLYAAADILALSSREDPYPSTALEALAAGAPVITVKGASGVEELGEHGCVQAIPNADPASFVEALAKWLDDEPALAEAANRGRDLIRNRFGFTTYAGFLAESVGLATPNISVVVPNYNYARHLPQRLQSILDQTLSARELIFLDDASTDDSLAAAEKALANASINWRLLANERNSSSVFAQWRRGVEQATGELIWIAEADDWADARFLETVAKPFRGPNVVLSMSQSHQADGDGRILAPDYLDYVADISPDKWRRPFVGDGLAEIRSGLSIKNTIPNASAVLFRRTALAATLRDHEREIASYRVAGDWCVYVNILRQGALAFSPTALNYHRRHDHSVTISRFGLAELAEIARMQAYVAREFAPDPDQVAKALAYLEKLVAQFELQRRFTPAQIEGAMRGVVTITQQLA